ncbi:hypothetical protein WJX84_008263 [Apatococcus fuscideae]|uniref:RRM domain-containing protein n=1 Tax=Apatococcus fuscideae TaxID=2026836 RepID=A0AAW1S7X4_9CHLO
MPGDSAAEQKLKQKFELLKRKKAELWAAQIKHTIELSRLGAGPKAAQRREGQQQDGGKHPAAKSRAKNAQQRAKNTAADLPRPVPEKPKGDPLQAAIQALAARKAQAAHKGPSTLKAKAERRNPPPVQPAFRPSTPPHGAAYSPTADQAYSPSEAQEAEQWQGYVGEPCAKRHRADMEEADWQQDMRQQSEMPSMERWAPYPTLYIGNLPADWTEHDIREVFANFHVRRVSIRHDKRCAFLDLESEEDLSLCLSSLAASPIQVEGPEPSLEDPQHPRSYLHVERARSQQPPEAIVQGHGGHMHEQSMQWMCSQDWRPTTKLFCFTNMLLPPRERERE